MPARFARLRIAGFKSFADATTVEILPGLTGVVGPNGCGKSNVIEALRWAMGESNARQMRGAEMEDVIFAGTTGRSSRNLAEVTLTLEETAGLAPPPFHEAPDLEISRKIERGSGSTYRVNGKEARARDVQTLFADLASGARASAMVSQGRVGALVNARPDERRALLEEAAGITGLHARRHEAELKLKQAEQNLTRADDLKGQIESPAGGAEAPGAPGQPLSQSVRQYPRRRGRTAGDPAGPRRHRPGKSRGRFCRRRVAGGRSRRQRRTRHRPRRRNRRRPARLARGGSRRPHRAGARAHRQRAIRRSGKPCPRGAERGTRAPRRPDPRPRPRPKTRR